MSDLQITAVPTEYVPQVWPQAKPHLVRAIETTRGRHTEVSVLDDILSGRLALWLVLDGDHIVAALTTRISDLPGVRILALDWIGGSRMREWLPLAHAVFLRYATDHGCSELHGYGRPAWGRALRAHGWEPDYTAYRLEIADGQRQR